jgi:hypothetical protein
VQTELGRGNNPRLALSVTARKLDEETMFNAAVINLKTGVQETGESADYKSLEDGIRVMEELVLKLSGNGEEATRIRAVEQERRDTVLVSNAASFARTIEGINGNRAGGVYTVRLNSSFTAGLVVFTAAMGKRIIRGRNRAYPFKQRQRPAVYRTGRGNPPVGQRRYAERQ